MGDKNLKVLRLDDPLMLKYKKMQKAGLPQGAVENGMIRDGVDPASLFGNDLVSDVNGRPPTLATGNIDKQAIQLKVISPGLNAAVSNNVNNSSNYAPSMNEMSVLSSNPSKVSKKKKNKKKKTKNTSAKMMSANFNNYEAPSMDTNVQSFDATKMAFGNNGKMVSVGKTSTLPVSERQTNFSFGSFPDQNPSVNVSYMKYDPSMNFDEADNAGQQQGMQSANFSTGMNRKMSDMQSQNFASPKTNVSAKMSAGGMFKNAFQGIKYTAANVSDKLLSFRPRKESMTSNNVSQNQNDQSMEMNNYGNNENENDENYNETSMNYEQEEEVEDMFDEDENVENQLQSGMMSNQNPMYNLSNDMDKSANQASFDTSKLSLRSKIPAKRNAAPRRPPTLYQAKPRMELPTPFPRDTSRENLGQKLEEYENSEEGKSLKNSKLVSILGSSRNNGTSAVTMQEMDMQSNMNGSVSTTSKPPSMLLKPQYVQQDTSMNKNPSVLTASSKMKTSVTASSKPQSLASRFAKSENANKSKHLTGYFPDTESVRTRKEVFSGNSKGTKASNGTKISAKSQKNDSSNMLTTSKSSDSSQSEAKDKAMKYSSKLSGLTTTSKKDAKHLTGYDVKSRGNFKSIQTRIQSRVKDQVQVPGTNSVQTGQSRVTAETANTSQTPRTNVQSFKYAEADESNPAFWLTLYSDEFEREYYVFRPTGESTWDKPACLKGAEDGMTSANMSYNYDQDQYATVKFDEDYVPKKFKGNMSVGGVSFQGAASVQFDENPVQEQMNSGKMFLDSEDKRVEEEFFDEASEESWSTTGNTKAGKAKSLDI